LLKRGYVEFVPSGLASKDFAGMRLRSLVYGVISEEFGALKAAFQSAMQ
jgi:hypothetical protein